jgi:RNA polymerase sigma factor (sigma-70 family)
MNRVVELLRGQLASTLTAWADATDRHLLDRFLAARDEEAFAEVVRRYGPVVWGVCRRQLSNRHDAEDAFQATFLVLVRRARRLDRDVPLGGWLHRVAAMTARNVIRGNRRRAPVSGPMEHEVPEPERNLADALDLDAALLALPERDRVPVVLCHLQGLTRREAAERIGCPEGTLSARLHRAMSRLRSRFGERHVAALAVASVTALPAGLAASTVRSAVIFTTSTLAAIGVSPAVAGLTDGVLRMFWMKKVAVGLALAVFVTGGLLAGFATRSFSVAQATEPPPAKQAPPDDLEAARKRLAEQIDDLAKRKAALDQLSTDLNAQLAKFDAVILEKQAAAAAAELGKDIAVSVGDGNPSGYTYTIREVVNGKVAEIHTSDIDLLKTYLTRAFSDPKGPKTLRVSAQKDFPYDDLRKVFAACAAAGYAKATFSHSEPRQDVREIAYTTIYRTKLRFTQSEPTINPGTIDLKQYAPKK